MAATQSVEGLTTRQLILQTAEQLFAQQGIDAVSLNEINKAAGQKNTSSLHYHFGNKDGLISAIVYSHYEEIEDKLQAALDALERDFDLEQLDLEQLNQASREAFYRQLVKAIIGPFFDKLADQRGVYYLIIVAQMLSRSTDLVLAGHPDNIDQARLRIFALFDRVALDIPAAVRIARLVLVSSLLFHSLASFAQFEQSAAPNPLGDKDFYRQTIEQMMLAMLLAPLDLDEA